jgi:phosphoribosylformylglycinamidine cyclo-ligase
VLPEGCHAEFEVSDVEAPPIFDYLVRHGGVDRSEAYRVFNMGLGFLLIVDPDAADGLMQELKSAGEPAVLVGEIQAGDGEVLLR